MSPSDWHDVVIAIIAVASTFAFVCLVAFMIWLVIAFKVWHDS